MGFRLHRKHFQEGICRMLLGTTLAAFILFGDFSEATKLVTYASELDGDTLIDPDQDEDGDETTSAGNDNTESGVSAPDVIAESAILMDARSGAILYEKNIHTQRYPASITKLLTCLVAKKNSELSDVVTFSKEAVFGIERRSSNIGIDVGETLTMEECLYAILLESANEVASAVAEHVGGSIEGFTRMMNEEAASLGCTDSNFVNANGLPDDNHYTSAYDMALIAQAFFADEKLSEISGTVYYQLLPTATQPDEINLQNHHRLLMGCRYGSKYSYEYTVGGKTGYTDVARQTLVTCAEKDGMRLICVILKDETPNHYLDTTTLFEYGFQSFYDVDATTVLGEEEISGMVQSAVGDVDYEICGENMICLPKGVTPDKLEARLEKTGDIISTDSGKTGDTISTDSGKTGDGLSPNAYIRFTYEGKDVGSIPLLCSEKAPALFIQNEQAQEEGAGSAGEKQSKEKKSFGFLSILKIFVLTVVFMALGLLGFVFFIRYKQEKERQRRRREIMERHRARRREEK